MIFGKDIIEFGEAQGMLFRGPKPVFGFPYTSFKAIINLETETKELLFGNPDEEVINCVNFGINYYDFALSGISSPRPSSVATILYLLKQSKLRPLYLHCRHGRERTGFIIAAYRMQHLDWPFDEAYRAWVYPWAFGCRWPYYLLWKNALRKWAKE